MHNPDLDRAKGRRKKGVEQRISLVFFYKQKRPPRLPKAAVLTTGSRQPPIRLARPLATKRHARLLRLGDKLLEGLHCGAVARAGRRSMRQTPPLLVATRGLDYRYGPRQAQLGFCSWLKIFEISDDKLSGCYCIKYHQVPAKMNGPQAFGIMCDKLGFRNKRYVPFVPVLKR